MALIKHRSTLLLLLVSLFAASQSASLFNTNELNEIQLPQTVLAGENVCAQTCNQLYSQVQFQTGKTYIYDVDLTTRIGSAQGVEYSDLPQSEQQVQISAHADVSVYSPCELVLKLRKVHLSGVKNHAQLAQQLEREPVHFAYEDGKVVDICASPAEDKWIVDVKKSIISALQMSSNDLSQTKTVIETDISGQCETIYQPVQHDSDTTIIRKMKQMNKCGQRHQFNVAFFPRSYGLDQVLRSSLPFVTSNSTNECTQVVKNQIIESVTCEDKSRVWPLGVQVYSKISLQLIAKKPSLQVQRLSQGFLKHRLTMSYSDMTFQSKRRYDQDSRDYSVNDVQQLLRQIDSRVQTSIQLDVPVLFSELVRSLHSLAPLEQAQLWEQIRSGELGSSRKLLDLFLDASALAGNEGSAEVLIRAYQQQQISAQRANYLFGLLSFVHQPTVEAAQRLVQFVQQQGQQTQQLVQIPRGVLFGITGFVHNLQIVVQQQHSNDQQTQVDQLVQQLATLLVQTLQQNIGQVSSQVQEHQLLTISYALRNLILAPSQSQQNQPEDQQIAQQLVQILQQVPYTQYNQEIRVAIVRTLVTAGIDDQIRQYLLEQLIQNTQEGIEIQIEAYRAVVLSGATQAQLEQIKQFTDAVSGQPQQQDLVNYIRSHQSNLRTTSDPQKQTVLPVNAPVFPQPSRQFFGISRNYEISYVNEALNLGVTAETDVIYDQQQTNQFAPVPQTVSFNLTIPIGGSELQLVEVRLHQHGLEPVIARHLAQIKRQGEKDPWKVAKETVEYIVQHGAELLADNPQIHLLLQISIDGKTVVLVDEQDLITGEIQQQTFIQEMMRTLHKQVSLDRAFGITPIDTVIAFPSVNGLPVQVRVNSSVVLGLKTDLTFDARDLSNSVVQFAVYPSVASQVETAVEFQAGPERKSVEYVQNFYSAPQLNLLAEVTKGRIISFKFNLPEQTYVLARVESQVFTRNENGQRVRIAKRNQIMDPNSESEYGPNVHVCTDSTHNPLGVVLCYDFSYSTPNANSVDVVAEITLVRSDPSLRSYELYLESPYSIDQLFSTRGRPGSFQSQQDQQPFGQLTPFKFVFNTPGSQIDREIVLEVELPSSASDRTKEARLRIQTPWKKIIAQASVRTEPKERIVSAEVSIDNQKQLQMELALETLRRGQKIEYRPRLVLAMDSVLERPVHLVGALTHSSGRKSMIHFQLEDVQAKHQYIKGTYIRDRGDRKSLAARTSADLLVSLAGLNAMLATTFELAERIVKLDLSADYQLPSWDQKEQAKIAFKMQNLSSGKMVKFVNFGLVKLSQYPKYQVRYSQNLMYAAGEQFEQDFKLGWAADDDEQVRFYQAVKKTGLRGKIDIDSQSIIVYRPSDINYEIKGTAALVGFGINGQKRYNIVVNGQARDQPNSDSNFQAEFAYSHMSKAPLKMKMRASLKANDVDFIYSDEIEEQQPSKYHGHLLIQLTPEEKYSADYVYEIKDQQNRADGIEEHELNVQFKNSRTSSTTRHHGLLRMEANKSWMVRSKMTDDQNGDIFDGELKRSMKEGKTQFYFNHYPKDVRAKFALDSADSTNGQWELSSPEWRHNSQFEFIPRQKYEFSSRTKRNDENVLEIESTTDRRARTQRFLLNSKPFEGEFQLDLPEDQEQKAKFRMQMPESWSHQTSFSRATKKPFMTLDSRTKYGSSNIADLSAKYDPEDEHYFRLNTPLARTDLNTELVPLRKTLKKVNLHLEAGKFNHQSKLSLEPEYDAFDFESETHKSGQPLVNVRYQLSADANHNIQIDSPQLLKASAECNLARSKPFASIDLKLNEKLTGQELTHQTKLTGEREGRSDSAWNLDAFQVESQTAKKNKNLAQIEAQISKKSSQKSFAKIRIGDHLESKIELDPYKNAKIKVDCPEYDHLTELSYQPSEDVESKGKWKIQSQTISLKNKNQRYTLDAEHQRNRRSAFKIDVPQFDSEFAYEYPESDLSNHDMLFQFNGKSLGDMAPVNHKTQMRFLNQGKKNPQIRLDSQTSRMNARNGEQENILFIEGAYNHNEPRLPSNLKLKLGKTLSGDLGLSLFNPNVQTVTLTGELQDDRFGSQGSGLYRHQTEARFQPRMGRLSVDSNTEKNGQLLAKLDSLLSTNPDEKSYLNLNAAGYARYPVKAQVEIEPRYKRALLDFDMAPYTHRTEFSKRSGPYQLKTLTTRDQENVFDLDGSFNPTTAEESYLKMKANGPTNQYHGEIFVHPAKRIGQLSLRTNNMKHDSIFKIEQDPTEIDDEQGQGKTAFFKTNTLYNDQVMASIDARLRGLRGENKIDAQLPQLSLKSIIDVPSKLGSFDLKHHRSGRHLLGSIAVNQKPYLQQQQQIGASNDAKSFHFDLAWDIDRDPASKVQIDLSAQRIPSQRGSSFLGRRTEDLVLVASAQYAQNQLTFNSQFVPEQVYQNPISVSLAYVPLDQERQPESWQLIYTHTLQNDNQYQCKWDFLVGNQLKYGLQLNGQVNREQFQFGAQVIAPTRPDLQVTFDLSTGVRAPGQQYYLEAKAVTAGNQQYQIIFDLTKHLETRKVDGKLELRFATVELHVVNFSIDLVNKQFQLEVTNEKTGKQVDIDASYGDNLVHLNAVSNTPFFPAIEAQIRYVPGEVIHAKLDLDQQRKFELTAKYTGELSTLQFYALTKVDSMYTPSVEFVAEGRKSPEDGNTQRLVSVSGKYNMVELVNAQFKQQDVQQWIAEAQIVSPSGEQLLDTTIQAIPAPSQQQQQYQVQVTPVANQYVQPFIAIVQEQQPTSANGYVRSIKIDLSNQQQIRQTQPQLIASAQVLLKQRQWSEVPQLIEITLQHVPTNSHGSFRVSIREEVDPQQIISQQTQDQQQQVYQPSLFDTVEQTTGVSSKRASRKVRDQAVVSWNQKSAGFSLITTEYGAGSNAVEHDLKVYTPTGTQGRIIQVRCAHQFTRELYFIKQQLRTNLAQQRDPIYQYTVLLNQVPQQGYTGSVQLESYKFVRSPKTVEFVLQPVTQQTPLNLKLRIDVGQSEKDAVTIKTVVQRQRVPNQIPYFGQSSLNNTIHISARTQDRSVLNFEVDAHVSDSSLGFAWQNVNRRGQLQQGQYLVRFIGQDRFEAVISNPTQRYLINGVYKRKDNSQQSPLIVDFVVSTLVNKHQSWASRNSEPVLVAEHKVHIESVDKCIRADIEDVTAQSQSQSQETVRQVNICVDMTRSSLVNVAVDSIKNGQKNAEFQARLDSRSVAQALQLSLRWNPQYSRQIIAALLQLNQQSQQTLTEQLSQQELIQELVHKYSVVGQKLVQDFALEPIYKIFIDELVPVAEEFGLTQQVIQQYVQIVIEPLERVWEVIEQYINENVEQWGRAYDEATEQLQRTCQSSRTCSKVVQIVSQIQSTQDLAQLITEPLVSLLQKTHRIVAHSQGKLIRNLPSIDWEQFVPEQVQEFVQESIETVYSIVRNVWYTQGNPFTGIWQHVETIVQELVQSSQWQQVRWQQVREAVQQVVQLVISPQAWSSSMRVLIWDPQNGQLQVQIKSPLTQVANDPVSTEGNTNTTSTNSSYIPSSSWLSRYQPYSNTGSNNYQRNSNSSPSWPSLGSQTGSYQAAQSSYGRYGSAGLNNAQNNGINSYSRYLSSN